jgi:hypothetical protein
VTVQTVADAYRAVVGGIDQAFISVVVTGERGEPLADLGDSVGDGSSPITLPAGWVLANTHVGGVGVPACSFQPTVFLNGGFNNIPGAYLIGVVPAHPECTWESGEYHYVVRIDMSGPENSGLLGSGLGKLTVP